jgi:8-amino-7-oxononanoate synthase
MPSSIIKIGNGKASMLDFTSALYLGMQHAHHRLCPWPALTTGRPAVLETPPGAKAVARALARLIGCEHATLGTSTLHIFFDLFQVLSSEGIAFFVDAGTYPIARLGAERMAAKGVPLVAFPTHDSVSLELALTRNRRLGLRPVVVTDGLSPAAGRPAPLDRYLRLARANYGWLVIDDTQALGILGERPTHEVPYGYGGGGTAAWYGLRAPELIVVASLAKGFGVPLAVLAGSRRLIEDFETRSDCRVHCSAPSAAHLAAAAHALIVNRDQGALLRNRLLRGIQRFRCKLRQAGLFVHGGFSPVQTPSLGGKAAAVHTRLLAGGVQSVLHQDRPGFPAQLSFLLSAAHPPWAIDYAAESLARIVNTKQSRTISARRKNHEQAVEI